VSLEGKHVIVTAGPTHEPIDPVRVIANRSSGRQGFATEVAGADVRRVDVETAQQMADAVDSALPADAAILVAAVADWRVEQSPVKLKKSDGLPKLKFLPNPDILAELSASLRRPRLLVGFAAETSNVVENGIAKQVAKGADWIVANDVSGDVMGGNRNRVHLVTRDGVEHWPEMSKDEVARRLIERVSKELQ
jgi:phosphopantothenoylcysteine decarboxylase/phosphopantothenate--cysteine ligase